VTPIRLHDLRHTHASLLLRDRVPIKVVSERLGHSNPAFTMTTYQHVLPGMQDDAARAFATIVEQGAERGSVEAGSDPEKGSPHSSRGHPDGWPLTCTYAWWRGRDLNPRPSGYE